MTTVEQPLDALAGDVPPLLADVLGPTVERWETFTVGQRLVARALRHPGRILSISTQRRIYDALVPVSTDSFAADMSPYWAQRSLEGYLERLTELVLVADADGAMVGWTSFHVLPFDDRTIVYIDSTGMVSRQQSRGVMREVLHRRVPDLVRLTSVLDKPVYLAARSESPVFHRLMRGLLTHPLHPHPEAEVPGDIVECGRLLAWWLGQLRLFDAGSLTIRGAYDTLDELYGELPTSGNAELDALFRDRLGPLDAFILIGRVD
ncbi:MAG TPA: hypothetical protein VK507_07115 [Iamia sp.]|nr:hypothetical protein [Iamia sp.]